VVGLPGPSVSSSRGRVDVRTRGIHHGRPSHHIYGYKLGGASLTLPPSATLLAVRIRRRGWPFRGPTLGAAAMVLATSLVEVLKIVAGFSGVPSASQLAITATTAVGIAVVATVANPPSKKEVSYPRVKPNCGVASRPEAKKVAMLYLLDQCD
jgi:hypothetical protein